LAQGVHDEREYKWVILACSEAWRTALGRRAAMASTVRRRFAGNNST
jgi:hypothetical protein